VPFAAQSVPQLEAVYPATVTSLAVCDPTATDVDTPLVTVVPSIFSVKSLTVFVPPLSFTTVLTSVRLPCPLLLNVHVTCVPFVRALVAVFVPTLVDPAGPLFVHVRVWRLQPAGSAVS